MPKPLSHRHRAITEDDLIFIRRLIAAHPGMSRRRLSAKLCEAWNWVQPNGAPRDMVCRGMMLMLHREGLIELPPVRFVPRNPMVERNAPSVVDVDQTALHTSLAGLGALQVRQVRRAPDRHTRRTAPHPPAPASVRPFDCSRAPAAHSTASVSGCTSVVAGK
jgi:hypothetical protein